MQTNAKELRQCTRCHSTILLEYFETNRKGELYKSCNNCRKNDKKYKDTHQEQIKEYRDSRKEETKEYGEAYREFYKDYIKDREKLYREKIKMKKNDDNIVET